MTKNERDIMGLMGQLLVKDFPEINELVEDAKGAPLGEMEVRIREAFAVGFARGEQFGYQIGVEDCQETNSE